MSNPLAIKAYYDNNSDKIVIVLDNDVEMKFPKKMISQKLDQLTEKDLTPEIIKLGEMLHWKSINLTIDVELAVTNMFDD